MGNELVTVMGDRDIVTSSRAVAENFGKDHGKILRSIEHIIDDIGEPKMACQLFLKSEYENRGKKYPEYLMKRDGFSLLAMGFTGKKALEWKIKYINCFNSMEDVVRRNSLEGQVQRSLELHKKQLQLEKRNHDDIISLKKQLKASGILREYIAPPHYFDHLVARWKEASSNERVRNFYDELGDYVGKRVPFSTQLHISVKEWLIENIGLDIIEEYVIGVETGTIVCSDYGLPVCKHGVFGNSVEWDKVKSEFNNSCAYCGKEDVTLIPEHIVSQSSMSRVAPERVDLINNIIPACKECNESKLRSHMQTWYHAQPFFTEERYWKICEHMKKYEVS